MDRMIREPWPPVLRTGAIALTLHNALVWYTFSALCQSLLHSSPHSLAFLQLDRQRYLLR